MKNCTLSGLNVASLVIEKSYEIGCGISNLKLQKLLYYVQAITLQEFNELAFQDDIESWRQGPAVRSVYSCYKRFVSDNIDQRDYAVTGNKVPVPEYVNFVVEYVVKQCIDYNPWELVDKTHKTTPWIKNYRPDRANFIPVKDLYTTEINI